MLTASLRRVYGEYRYVEGELGLCQYSALLPGTPLARSETSTSDYTHALVVQHSCNYTRPTHYGNNEQWRMLYVAPAIAHTCWY